VLYRFLADAVLVAHALFVLFVVLGGIAVIRWPRVAIVQIPAAVWGALIEFRGWICPLTPLENSLRRLGNEEGFSGGFVEHYLLRTLYPAGLTDRTQWILGTLVIVINLTAYGFALSRFKRGGNAD
jgi:hypothetical protein